MISNLRNFKKYLYEKILNPISLFYAFLSNNYGRMFFVSFSLLIPFASFAFEKFVIEKNLKINRKLII